MGSTATVLLLTERSAFVAHVGDSRVYQLRGGRKVFRTFDHSMVFDLVRQGVITEEQARLSAQSNIITRALGIQPDVQVDVAELPYEKGDRFVLCSDGIHGIMPEKELIHRLSNRKSVLGAVVDDIATYVDNLGHMSGGGHDNLTLAVVETKNNSKLKPKMSKQVRITLMCLAAVCIISIILNIVQATGKCSHASVALPADSSLTAWVAAQQDTIKSLAERVDSLTKQLNEKPQNP